VAKSLHEARREVAERLDLSVDAATRDPHDGEMPVLLSIADGAALRGLPAVGPLAGGSAIRGTEPGSDHHLDLMDGLR
jgi:hypothetical protein